MIEEYKFGLIKINGKTFNYDVEVRWTGEVLEWWRKEGHLIDLEDIERAINQKPETIVIGKGALGVCRLTKNCQEFIKKRKIKLIVEKTKEAVEIFNNLLKESKEKVIGLFHLTC